jgi:hypothetical protein
MPKRRTKKIKAFHSQQGDKMLRTHHSSKITKIQGQAITLQIHKKSWIDHIADSR